MGIAHLTDRSFLRVSGADARPFLQSLITQDMNLLRTDNLIYSLLLTPQGRYAADFFLKDEGDAILIDVYSQHRDRLHTLLTRYKLRQRVTIEKVEDLQVWALWGQDIERAYKVALPDPRLKCLGRRSLLDSTEKKAKKCDSDYQAYQMSLGVTDSAHLVPEKSIPLEYGLHQLQGISLDKGCYLGQELIARTLHRGQIRKRVLPARILEGVIQPGENVCLDQEEIGKVIAVCKDWALVRVLFESVVNRSDPPSTLQTSENGFLCLTLPEWMKKA